jgi:integrase
VTLPTLRHSTAYALIAAGEHIKVVQQMLGHSSDAITADIYSHVNVQQQRAAAERLGEASAPLGPRFYRSKQRLVHHVDPAQAREAESADVN